MGGMSISTQKAAGQDEGIGLPTDHVYIKIEQGSSLGDRPGN
jgi:hypothetical protein